MGNYKLVIVSKVRGSIPISISLPSVIKRGGAGLANIRMHKFVFGFKKNFLQFTTNMN
jgi:hypothetical protein